MIFLRNVPVDTVCRSSPYFSGHRTHREDDYHTVSAYDERMLHELSIRQLRMNTKALVEPGDTVLRYRSSDGIL